MRPFGLDPSPPEATATYSGQAPRAEPPEPRASEGGAVRNGRRRLILALKLTVTTAVGILIVRAVDWPTLWADLLGAHMGLIAVAAAIRLLGVLVSAYKWQRILGVQGSRFPLRQLVSWYFIGMFLSNLLPGSIGGDAYRIYKTRMMRGREAGAILAVFLERASGMVALLLVGYAAALLTYGRLGDDLSGLLALGGTLMIVAAPIGIAVARRIRARRHRWLRWPLRMVDGVLRLLREFRARPGEAALVAGLSLFFHVNRVLAFWFIMSALGVSIHFTELAVAGTFAVIAGALPISFGGLGVLDGTFVLFLGHYGVPTEEAVSTMLLSRALMLLSWVPGLLLYLRRERNPSGPTGRDPVPVPEWGRSRLLRSLRKDKGVNS